MHLINLMKELKALLLVYFVGLFLNGLVIYQFFKELIFLVAVDLVKLKDELVFGGMGDFFKFLFSSIVVFSMLWAFYFLMYVLFIFFNKSITRKKSTIFLLFLFVNFGISVLNFIGIIPGSAWSIAFSSSIRRRGRYESWSSYRITSQRYWKTSWK